MTQSKKIAVTGGIGSGKSTVLSMIERLGYPTYSCDEISRSLWERQDYRKELAKLFPNCTYNGEIDKKKLSAHVFSDREALQKLNAFSHPVIMRELLQKMEGGKTAFAEVPLLFEGGYESLFDEVIIIARERYERIRAVMRRDSLSESEVTARIANQMSDAKLDAHYHLIENNGSEEALFDALKRLLDSILPEIG